MVQCVDCAYFGNQPAPAAYSNLGFGLCDMKKRWPGTYVSIIAEHDCHDFQASQNAARVAALRQWCDEKFKREPAA